MKTFLIVGGTSGVGLETTKKLVNSNNKVIVVSRKNKNLENLENVEFLSADIAKDADELPEIKDSLNGIVYAPGTINLKPFRSLKISDFQNDFDINFLGAVKIISKYLTNLNSSENGSIVLFSTVAVQTGMKYHASIAAAKGAVEGLTKSLAAEFAPKTRVNCIAPSITDTPLAEKLSEERHPLNRIGDPKEVAELVSFLLSDDSRFLTGQIFKVDGGLSSIKSL